jgi:hypothetical protein
VLEDWVQQTLADNPQLQDLAAAGPKAAAGPAAPKPAAPEATAFAESRAAPPAPPGPADPFDPLPFNRQMHPERGPR